MDRKSYLDNSTFNYTWHQYPSLTISFSEKSMEPNAPFYDFRSSHAKISLLVNTRLYIDCYIACDEPVQENSLYIYLSSFKTGLLYIRTIQEIYTSRLQRRNFLN